MRQLLSILAGVVAGAVVLIGVLLGLYSIGTYGAGIQDTGPGMALSIIMMFGIAPLFFTTLLTFAVVSWSGWPRRCWPGALLNGVLSAIAFGAVVSYFDYAAQMGVAVVAAGFVAGAFAAGVATVLGAEKKSRVGT